MGHSWIKVYKRPLLLSPSAQTGLKSISFSQTEVPPLFHIPYMYLCMVFNMRARKSKCTLEHVSTKFVHEWYTGTVHHRRSFCFQIRSCLQTNTHTHAHVKHPNGPMQISCTTAIFIKLIKLLIGGIHILHNITIPGIDMNTDYYCTCAMR